MNVDQSPRATTREEGEPLDVVTVWTGPDAEESEEAKRVAFARDYLFRQRVADVLNEQAPWLIPILRQARATIVAGPGKLFVMFNGDMQSAVEIEPLGAHLVLMPWAEPGEPQH